MNIKNKVTKILNNDFENQKLEKSIKNDILNDLEKNNIDILFDLDITIVYPFLTICIYPYDNIKDFKLNSFFFESMLKLGFFNFTYNTIYGTNTNLYKFEFDLTNLND